MTGPGSGVKQTTMTWVGDEKRDRPVVVSAVVVEVASCLRRDDKSHSLGVCHCAFSSLAAAASWSRRGCFRKVRRPVGLGPKLAGPGFRLNRPPGPILCVRASVFDFSSVCL